MLSTILSYSFSENMNIILCKLNAELKLRDLITQLLRDWCIEHKFWTSSKSYSYFNQSWGDHYYQNRPHLYVIEQSKAFLQRCDTRSSIPFANERHVKNLTTKYYTHELLTTKYYSHEAPASEQLFFNPPQLCPIVIPSSFM